MTFPLDDDPQIDTLSYEHRLLLRLYGDAQQRCSRQIVEQAAEIERLEAEILLLRGRLIERDSRRWLAPPTLAGLLQGAASVVRGLRLRWRGRRFKARVQALFRQRPGKTGDAPTAAAPTLEELGRSLAAADLVICQTGCLSHKDFWRVRNACKRTGKTCVLVTDPDALRRIGLGRNRQQAGQGTVRAGTVQPAAGDAGNR